MWFNPSELSKTKKQTSANLANPANWEEESAKTVPPISKLAELAESFNSKVIITETGADSQISKLAELAAPLDLKNDTQRSVIKPNDQQKLLDYMAAIGETDKGMIDGLLDRCASDADYLKWILDWANKLLSPSRRPKTQTVSCRGCRYFKCLNAHGGGAGKCGIGARSAGYYNWSDDSHECSEYLN